MEMMSMRFQEMWVRPRQVPFDAVGGQTITEAGCWRRSQGAPWKLVAPWAAEHEAADIAAKAERERVVTLTPEEKARHREFAEYWMHPDDFADATEEDLTEFRGNKADYAHHLEARVAWKAWKAAKGWV